MKIVFVIIVLICSCSHGKTADIGCTIPIPTVDINSPIPTLPEPPPVVVKTEPQRYEYRCINGMCYLVPITNQVQTRIR